MGTEKSGRIKRLENFHKALEVKESRMSGHGGNFIVERQFRSLHSCIEN